MERTQIQGYDSDGKVRELQVNPSGSIDVALQDQTTPTVFMKAIIEEGEFTLASDIVLGEYTFDTVNSHGISVGDHVEFYNVTRWLQVHALSIAVDTPIAGTDRITVDQPFDYAYAVASTTCYRGVDELNVNGSSTPVIARIKNIDLSISWDITQVDIYIQDGTDMDNAQFGGLGAALVRGVLWRGKKIIDSITIFKNSVLAKINADMVLLSNTYAYNDRAPSGSYSLALKKLLGGQSNLGVVFRLVAGEQAELQIVIQDDLRNLQNFWIRFEGSVVLP